METGESCKLNFNGEDTYYHTNIMATQAERFAKCVKNVTKKTKKEGLAIAICTKAILWPQGRTIRRFSMYKRKPKLITQKRKFGSKPSRK